MKKRRILFITGMRSDFYIQENIINELCKIKKVEHGIIITGGHLKKNFGNTYKYIDSKGYNIVSKINNLVESDSLTSRIKGISNQLPKIILAFKKFKPNIIVAPYDREESISIALVATYMNIPIAHLGAGDITNVNVDGVIRHSVSKLSHIFFTSTKQGYERLIKMGEDKSRIYNVGHTVLDRYINSKKISKKDLSNFYNFDFFSDPTILFIQHPVSNSFNQSAKEIKISLSVLDEMNLPTIIILPNSDLGSYAIRKEINKYNFRNKKIKIFKNIPENYFVNTIKNISVIVGNSSMGVLEAPLFNIPVVNIGKRQLGRENARNILFVPHNKLKIKNAIKKSLFDKSYIKKIKYQKNPYKRLNASREIAKILANIKIDQKLLNKKNTY